MPPQQFPVQEETPRDPSQPRTAWAFLEISLASSEGSRSAGCRIGVDSSRPAFRTPKEIPEDTPRKTGTLPAEMERQGTPNPPASSASVSRLSPGVTGRPRRQVGINGFHAMHLEDLPAEDGSLAS